MNEKDIRLLAALDMLASRIVQSSLRLDQARVVGEVAKIATGIVRNSDRLMQESGRKQ